MPITWTPTTIRTRTGEEASAERGVLVVPENRERGSATIDLHMVRIRARSERKGPTVVFLSGGPGDSGIQWAQHGPFLRAFLRVAEGVDLILLDQRGSGESGRTMRLPLPVFGPESLGTDEGFCRFTQEHVVGAATEHREAGAHLEAYNVLESASDLESLRLALGEETHALWTYSYGTHLAQFACRLFPSSFERVVLCGFEGPDHTLKLPSNIQAQLERLALISKTDDLLGRMSRVHRALGAEPLAVDLPTGRVHVGRLALQCLVASWAGISNRFGRIGPLYASLEANEKALLAEALGLYAKALARPLVFYLKDAASGASQERLALIEREAPECLLGNAANHPFPWIRPLLGASDIGDAQRRPLESDLPFLVLTGSLDGFTPNSNALESMPFLPGARHFVIENAAHNDLISPPEVVEAIARFLAAGEMPEPDFRPSLQVPRA